MAVYYAAEIVLALEFVHGKNIMHRDLKPENIMFGEDGHLRVIDFGDAKEFDEEKLSVKIQSYMDEKEND